MFTGLAWIVWLFTGVILGWVGATARHTLEHPGPVQPAAPVGPDSETLEKIDEAQRQVKSRDRQISFLWMRIGQQARGDHRIDEVD